MQKRGSAIFYELTGILLITVVALQWMYHYGFDGTPEILLVVSLSTMLLATQVTLNRLMAFKLSWIGVAPLLIPALFVPILGIPTFIYFIWALAYLGYLKIFLWLLNESDFSGMTLLLQWPVLLMCLCSPIPLTFTNSK